MEKDNQKRLIAEFLRYAVVGGVSFLADLGVMTLAKELLFQHEEGFGIGLALCVALGFVSGLAVNYRLSCAFVFRSAEQRTLGRGLIPFLLYAAVGVIGFFLTELGMYLGVSIIGSEGFRYALVKCVVAGLVLVWNYVGRKIFVYKGK
ncbi:MAG: GtrA family protein [Clostridia bacterium]|nr:GtrA family protein [Clostridia bacterium]